MGKVKTAPTLAELFPFTGGKELAQCAIDHLGEGVIEDILPIYKAICGPVPGYGTSGPGLANLAEAIQYRDLDTLQYMAQTGLYNRSDAPDTEPYPGLRDRCALILRAMQGVAWTPELVREHLPHVPVLSNGETFIGRVTGRKCDFAQVTITTPFGSVSCEFAWGTLAHVLNTGSKAKM